MTTSDKVYNEAFVWIWLPEETEPVVAGKLEVIEGKILFNYGKSYLERVNDAQPAIPIYEPELPLKSGSLPLIDGLTMPSCIRDAAPDAWGRRVIINKHYGFRKINVDVDELSEMSYLLDSGSDRIGALDFQLSPTVYESRSGNHATLDELLESAERVENGVELNEELDKALIQGSAIGGARPKALVDGEGVKYIAKFSLSTDLHNVVKAEYVAMRLAKIVGLNVAPVKLVKALGKDVLLIERFDRNRVGTNWTRRSMVSALTMFGLDEMMARYASYEHLAEIIRHKFYEPKDTLREVFSRLVFNILCGNTDDHARNHAAFCDEKRLSITPAYDICPQERAGNEATQAMLIDNGNRFSQLNVCLLTANNFLLNEAEARDIFDHQRVVIEDNWEALCDEAEMVTADRNRLWRRAFLNPFSFEGL